VPVGAPNPGGYLTAFLDEMHGRPSSGLTMIEAFRASRATLIAQQAADQGLHNVTL
jgi:hypothetical protein